MTQSLPFNFEVPVNFFEKAEAEDGKTRRIGGIVSLESRDRQDEVILQRGLDFSDFQKNGWFNDNHSKETDGILGYPEATQYFRKGQSLPDGSNAKAAGHWVEGYLLDTDKADRIWDLGKALQKTKRRLGFSVEGKIQKREGPARNTIAAALVRNVAITNCPVHAGTRMEILAKSLQAVTDSDSMLDKALTMGHATNNNSPSGVKTGEGAGAVLATESLERDKRPDNGEMDLQIGKKKKKKKDEESEKSFTDAQAFAWYQARLPNATPVQIGRLIQIAHTRRAKES